MDISIDFIPPRVIGRTQSWEAELFLNNPPVELYFMSGMKSKNLPETYKGVIPHRPICRAWLINEGPTDLYFDFGSVIEGSNDSSFDIDAKRWR